MKSLLLATAAAGVALTANRACAQTPPRSRNVVLFVVDGLRPSSVTPNVAPTLTKLKRNGVSFHNSHSIFPTFTTANASAMATGHFLGDTGDFSNTIFTGYPVQPANGTETAFIENDVVLGDIDDHFMSMVKDPKGGKIETGYLDEETILAAARAAGYHTAAIGKVGRSRSSITRTARLSAHRRGTFAACRAYSWTMPLGRLTAYRSTRPSQARSPLRAFPQRRLDAAPTDRPATT